MKLYLYYLMNNQVIDKLYHKGVMDVLMNYHTIDSAPILYAATTSKKVAKKFEDCRNMNVLQKVTKEIDGDAEADMWAIMIKEKSLLFSDKKHLITPLTGAEAWCVDNCSEIIHDYLGLYCNIHPDIFTDEFAEVLKTIGYIDALGYYDFSDGIEEWSKYRIDGVEEWANELGMFVWMFSDVVNLPGIMKWGDIDEDMEVVCRYKNTIK